MPAPWYCNAHCNRLIEASDEHGPVGVALTLLMALWRRGVWHHFSPCWQRKSVLTGPFGSSSSVADVLKADVTCSEWTSMWRWGDLSVESIHDSQRALKTHQWKRSASSCLPKVQRPHSFHLNSGFLRVGSVQWKLDRVPSPHLRFWKGRMHKVQLHLGETKLTSPILSASHSYHWFCHATCWLPQ